MTPVLIIVGLLLLSSVSKSAPTGILATGQYATPPVPRAASPAGRASSGLGGAGGAAAGKPGTQPTGQTLFNALENLFNSTPTIGQGPDVIDTGSTGAAFQPGGIFSDPTSFAGTDNFWDGTTQAPTGNTDMLGQLVGSVAADASGIPQFVPDTTVADSTDFVDPTSTDFVDPSTDLTGDF